MLRDVGLWLADNAIALGALAVAAWAHWRVARTDRVMLRVEHEVGPIQDGFDGTVIGLAHYVRVTNRGRHPTEIDRVWVDAHNPRAFYERQEVDIKESRTRKVEPGGTWKCRIDNELARVVDLEFAPVYIIVRDVVTDTEWRGRFRTEMDREQEDRARAQK